MQRPRDAMQEVRYRLEVTIELLLLLSYHGHKANSLLPSVAAGPGLLSTPAALRQRPSGPNRESGLGGVSQDLPAPSCVAQEAIAEA